MRVAPSLMGTHGVLPPRLGGSWRPHLQGELRHRSWGDCCSCQGGCWVRTLQGPSCTLSLGTLSVGHSSWPRGGCPQAGCTPPPPQDPKSIVLGTTPALRGWGEDSIWGTSAAHAVLGTWDLVSRGQRLESGLVFCLVAT